MLLSLSHLWLSLVRGLEVTTPLGRVLGKDYGDFVAFKGLPYAEEPGRFEAPRAKLPWNGTWNGTRFRSSCMHGFAHHDEDPLESYDESEDCLYANVWAPKMARSLPVVVFIHGGGFMRNSGSDPNFWGDGFVQAGAILVTFNYRLGIFGFFSWPGSSANVGFQDQQQLLRWVQQNIAAFGGDAQRVALMGQSAGAMSVLCHLAAPGSKGLFQRALAHSPVGLYYRDRASNGAFVRAVAEALLCVDVVRCLERRPAKELRDVDVVPEYLRHLTRPCPECANLLAWLPIIDPETLPMNPVAAIESGRHHKVPTIISTVTNETLGFLPTIFMKLSNNELTYHELLRLFFDDRALEAAEHYGTAPDTSALPYVRRAGVLTTDVLMTCYGRYVARGLAAFGETYLSTFMVQGHSSPMHNNEICVEGPPNGASCHAGDIPYQIPVSERMRRRTQVGYANEREEGFARAYARALVQFASGQSSFTAYNSSDFSSAWTLDGPQVAQNYHREHCDFWEAVGYADVWTSRPRRLVV